MSHQITLTLRDKAQADLLKKDAERWANLWRTWRLPMGISPERSVSAYLRFCWLQIRAQKPTP